MNAMTGTGSYQLRFQSLFHPGRCYAFPCDSGGRVDLDRLGDKLRDSYFFVRAVVGRDVAAPQVHPVAGADD